MGIAEIMERQVAQWNAEQAARQRALEKSLPVPIITISRQLGSGGAEVAKQVAIRQDCALAGYDIVNSIAGSLGISKELLTCMDERLKSRFKSWFDSSFCGEVDQEDYHRYMKATIRSLAELGSVVMLGRGAAFVKTNRPKINIRIVAPRMLRIERVSNRRSITRKASQELIDTSDRERARFIQTVYGKDWDDSLNYSLVINTQDIDILHAATLIEAAWQNRRDDAVAQLFEVGPEQTWS